MLPPNTILQNRYRIVRELGRGGMGTVYETVDQRVDCIVALKETAATRDGEARSAFKREAALLGNLRHQALPKVTDYFSENDGDFLVMEFIPGYDLAELLELRGSPFPEPQVLRWAEQLLRVLEYLHEHEPPILHRDIKPSNLKLTKQGEIFLLDFGLAKGVAGQMPTLATSRSVRGYTPVYASLEQIHGQGSDARSDLYSLGAALYHLLSGFPPVDAPTRFHAIEDDQPDPLQPIQVLNPEASAHVCEIIRQAMSLSRKQRHVSAAEMRKALRNAAEEDERSSAEAEYARAAERSREREEQRRQDEKEESRRAQEEKKLQEAETRKKAAEAEARRLGEETQEEDADRQRNEKARRYAEEDRLRAEAEGRREAEQERALWLAEEARHEAEERERAEETRRRDKLPLTVPGPTVRAEEQPAQKVPSALQIRTIQAQPPESSTGQLPSRETQRPEAVAARPRKLPGSIVIAPVIIAVTLAGVLGVWLLTGNRNPEIASTAQPVQPTEQSGGNTLSPPPGMVYVPGVGPGGVPFLMGLDDGDVAERPSHQVEEVKPFYIDVNEVTNEDYDKFVRATNHPAPSTWKDGSFPSRAARKPVTGVTWDDANSYSRWAGKRLPTEEEWEFAAHGTSGGIYPWGWDWRPGAANANGANGSLVDVGTYKGVSQFGANDMVGNAWEWTASAFRAYPGGRLPANLPAGDLKVIRGGSYQSNKEYATTTYRAGWPARGARTYDQTGFRCAKDVSQ